MGDTVTQMTSMNQLIADIQSKAAASQIRADASALSLTNAMALQKQSIDEQFAKMMAAIFAISSKMAATPDGPPLVPQQDEAAASSELAVVATAGAGNASEKCGPARTPPDRRGSKDVDLQRSRPTVGALSNHPSNESASGEAPFHKTRLVGDDVAPSSVPVAGQTS